MACLERVPAPGPLVIVASLGALPGYRRQDVADGQKIDRVRNAATISRAIDAPRRDRVILIFPEGMSQPEPSLMPLRTARMVLGDRGRERRPER